MLSQSEEIHFKDGDWIVVWSANSYDEWNAIFSMKIAEKRASIHEGYLSFSELFAYT